jgi:hypothetical protein
MAQSSPHKNSVMLFSFATPAHHQTFQKNVMDAMQHSVLHMVSLVRKVALSFSATMKFGMNWEHFAPKHSLTQQFATNHSSTPVANPLKQVPNRLHRAINKYTMTTGAIY